ncbi:4831_t:CDS:2, partial [Cetraspora pellucida]
NSSSTKVIEQSSDSFPTATATDNTEFLRGNNRKSKKRKRSNVSNNKKGKQRMQYSPTEADLDEHESTSSNSEESQTSEIFNGFEKNKALLLKNNLRNSQLIVDKDRLFSKSRSIENLLVTDLNDHFNDNEVINCSLPPLLSYSTNIKSLEDYFKEWASQFNQLFSTKTRVEERMLKM